MDPRCTGGDGFRMAWENHGITMGKPWEKRGKSVRMVMTPTKHTDFMGFVADLNHITAATASVRGRITLTQDDEVSETVVCIYRLLEKNMWCKFSGRMTSELENMVYFTSTKLEFCLLRYSPKSCFSRFQTQSCP